MIKDYRNTVYCSELSNIKENKTELLNKIRKVHPDAIDIYRIIRKNNDSYKKDFMKIYNCKCAYCGISINVISIEDFEIDHYKYKKSPDFKTPAYAGYIENLVLACHNCNNAKSSFEIPEKNYFDLFPDDNGITNSFKRNDEYYIVVADEKKEDKIISDFYNKLHFGSELHRVDYLLMNMIGLLNNIKDDSEISSLLGRAIFKLQKKRNEMTNFDN